MTAAALALLRAVPLWAWAIVAVVIGLALGLAAQTMRLNDTRVDLANEKAASTAQRAQYAAAAASASQAYRAEEQRRTTAHQEIAHVAQQAQLRAADDRRSADAAAGRLQQRFAAAAAARCGAPAGDTAAAPGSPPASAPGDLLADVQRRLDEAAGQFAAVADDARIAGQACQRAYESLTDAPAGMPAVR